VTIEDARCPTDPAFWDMSRACPGTIETWPRSTILADFRMLTDKAKHYRRQSFGRSRDLPIRKVNQRAFTLLSHYLWLIGHMVDRHPELRDEHQKWLQPYPTFTSGWGAEVSLNSRAYWNDRSTKGDQLRRVGDLLGGSIQNPRNEALMIVTDPAFLGRQ